ncbi:MAG: helix-turn-helix domain-containing protein [Geodermatophilaceae bacterium]|nr:helix-turn-helix domain-containing protein [Geodermatophilaceae bacterium]
MPNAAQQPARSELADFLRTRRQQIAPENVGLQMSGQRRTPGLRREEVSLLSGVSLTWYTWLEQAREMKPSRQVMDALARTLRMSTAEHAYILRLSGHVIEAPLSASTTGIPAHSQRLLDALGPSPAYAITPHWTIVGWNRAYEAFYPNVATTAMAQRNLLWLVFTDPYVRDLLVDWPIDSRRFLTQFRAEAGSRVHDRVFAELIGGLQEVSEQFRLGWASHDVDQFTSSERRFEHPRAGTLLLEHHRLEVSDCPDLHVVVYTAAPGSDTARKLTELVADPPPRAELSRRVDRGGEHLQRTS